MTAPARRLPTEIAHILFMDIIGYSLLSIEEQARLVERLQQIVREAPEFQSAQEHGDLICLDRGDGMALVFFGDPVAPVQCAVEIAQAVRAMPSLKLRMGINSGPVSRLQDIQRKENVSGDGINRAQRVMDCGEAGHILLSRSSAEVLVQFESWAAHLHDLGECEVKHGQRLHLFSLHTDEVGNRTLPQKVSAIVPTVASPHEPNGAPALSRPAEQEKSRPTAKAAGPRVVLLYKRNAQPDEYLLKLLETQLRAQGFGVFVDRHLTIGIEWATEIEHQIRAAEAVIVLLSEASTRSEMLEYELQTAHQAAQAQQGRPRILPVRINYTDRLPDPLAVLLDPLHYTLWRSPEDDARLVTEVVTALRSPPAPRPAITPDSLEPVGGAVPLASQFYIQRPADAQFTAAIARQDSIVLVKGARQMGKTSLLARGLQQARGAGARTVVTDLQALDEVHLATADTFLLALATAIAGQLKLGVSPRKRWDPDLGANDNMEGFLCDVALDAFPEPLVWGLDEVDKLFTCPFGSGVFGLFRSWHNRRSLDPTGPWTRLTLAIAYATEAHLFITDLNQSPFNVGTRLTVEDFTLEQVRELNRRYGAPLQNEDALGRFYRLVNGHPYLVRRGLDEMVTRGLDIGALEAQADRDEGLFGDHLRRLLVSLSKDKELTDVMRGVLGGASCPTSESFYRLRSAGVLVGDSARAVRPRCQLYTTYLTRHLL